MRRRGKLFVGCLVFILAGGGFGYLFRKPVLTEVGNLLVVADPLGKADAIEVLGGHVATRSEKAAELYKQGWAPRILVTKEIPPYEVQELKRFGIRHLTVWETAAEVLRFSKVPPSAITILDGYNESTVDEARHLCAYMQEHGMKRLIVVTSCYHARRTRLVFRRIFRRAGLEVLVAPTPPDWQFNPDGWWTRRIDAKALLAEYVKLFAYALRYW